MEQINFFDILAKVIDVGIITEMNSLKIPKEEIFTKIYNEIKNNRKEWYANRIPNLNYCEPDCRLAYLYVVAASNANAIKEVIVANNELSNYIFECAQTNGNIRVCVFGAGPGTELLAFSKFFDQRRPKSTLTFDFLLVDKVQEWNESWFGIRNCIFENYKKNYGVNPTQWPIYPNGNFIQCDITNIDNINKLGGIWKQHIYLLNFILSEVFSDNPGLDEFMKMVSNQAPSGSRFVFLERRGFMWQRKMTRIANAAGLELSPFVENRQDILDADEKPEIFGEIFDFLSKNGEKPKQSWNIVYSIGKKA